MAFFLGHSSLDVELALVSSCFLCASLWSEYMTKAQMWLLLA